MQIKDLNIDQLRLRILEERGLGGIDDYHPEKIFHYAISKYTRENPDFKDKIIKMDVLHQGLMQKILSPNADIQLITLELNKFDKIVDPNDGLIIKEEKEELEDDYLAKDDWIDVQEDEPLVIQVIDPDDLNKAVIIETRDDDVIITERTSDEVIDTTTITHIVNDEVVEQVQEVIIHPEIASSQDTFVHAPEDSDILASTDSITEKRDPDFLIPNTPDIQLIISNDEAPTQETHNVDFVKTGEPVVEEIEQNDFSINEPELTPVAVSVPEIDEIVQENKPRLDLDD